MKICWIFLRERLYIVDGKNNFIISHLIWGEIVVTLVKSQMIKFTNLKLNYYFYNFSFKIALIITAIYS